MGHELSLIRSLTTQSTRSFMPNNHEYSVGYQSSTILEIALAGINYFEMFNKLKDLGSSRFIKKTSTQLHRNWKQSINWTDVFLTATEYPQHRCQCHSRSTFTGSFGGSWIGTHSHKRRWKLFFLSSFISLVEIDVIIVPFRRCFTAFNWHWPFSYYIMMRPYYDPLVQMMRVMVII